MMLVMMRVLLSYQLFSWIPDSWRLEPELSFLGFYITPLFVIGIVTLILGIITIYLLDRFDCSKYIWHPPLFILALLVVYGVLLSFAFLPR